MGLTDTRDHLKYVCTLCRKVIIVHKYQPVTPRYDAPCARSAPPRSYHSWQRVWD